MSSTPPAAGLPRAHGAPLANGVIRAAPADFVVVETIGFEPSGDGAHVYLWIEKQGLNTEEVARRIAHVAGTRPADVGFAGLKDRHACTRQWFSVQPAADRSVAWQDLSEPGWRVLACTRHARKLRRGAVAGNTFEIIVRELDVDAAALAARLACIGEAGVPNYFGPQRFGRDGGNVEQARALLAGRLRVRDRHRRGLYLSAARSELFNAVCARRVSGESWNRAIPGDVLMLEGSRSVFVVDEPDSEIAARVARMDLHPTGPMPGRGGVMARDQALALEREALDGYADLEQGLAAFGLELDRRALRLPVRDLAWEALDARTARVCFRLPAGGYATTVLRELVECAGD